MGNELVEARSIYFIKNTKDVKIIVMPYTNYDDKILDDEHDSQEEK
jgi:hypothetical protein